MKIIEPEKAVTNEEGKIVPRPKFRIWRWASGAAALLFIAVLAVQLWRGKFPILGAAGVWLAGAVWLVLAIAAYIMENRDERRNWFTRLGKWFAFERVALGGLILGGLWLRVWGQQNGLPYIIPSDEPLIVDTGTHILKTGNFDPQMYYYPSFYIYLQTIAYALAFLWGSFTGLYNNLTDLPDKTYAITTAPQIYVWGRWLAALFGAIGIGLVYFTVVKIWQDKKAAWLAAGFLAFSALAIENSHYITVDIPLATMALATLYPAWKLMERGRWRDYTLAGVLAGLTIGSKWTGISIVTLLFVAHLLHLAKIAPSDQIKPFWILRHFLSLKLLLSLATVALALLATTPYLLARIGAFSDGFGFNLVRYRLAQTDYSTDFPWQGNLQVLWEDSGLLLLFGLGGIILALVKRERRNLLLISYPLIYLLSLNSSRLIYKRNLLPFTYYLTILAALFLVFAVDWIAKKVIANRLPLTPTLSHKGRGNRNVTPHPNNARLEESRESSPLSHKGRGNKYPSFKPRYAVLSSVFYLLLLLWVMWVPLRNVFYGNWYNDQPYSYVRAEEWLKREAGRGVFKLVEMRQQQWGAYPNTFAVFGDESRNANNFPLSYYQERGIAYLAINRDLVASRNSRNIGTYPELLQPNLIAQEIETKSVEKPGPPFAIVKTGVTAATLKLEHPLKADFSGKLALLGINAGKIKALNEIYLPQPGDIKNQWPTFKPGEIVGLTVYWQVAARLEADYVVYIHLVPLDKPDIQVANRDTQPLLGAYPTSQWKTGEMVIDQPNLALPDSLAPGDYALRMGLYLNDGKFTPLPLSDGSRFVTLGQIKVAK